ncbi:rRNA maturation RNase YbeY [Dermatobacter hominis]|uniref:rRNA maturation RNase YbeY n=1 Tax=Dermatobacter hominis TaxID=2884263 RepID=UPI001D114AF2|nr:rRNA maturation RNase YbeY [Dermatobacter hominis]UDY35803.1 rRNA maturation RNase YbeY [Dermatobacter hominis]
MTTSDDRPAVARRDDRDPAAAAALPVDLDALADLLADVLSAEGVDADAEASLQLVAAEAIAELKAEHLGGTGPTDVLSFPLDGIDGEPPDWIVGDVVVCPEVASSQAAEHAGDLDSELALLVVHGGLHLCGWDHATDDERDRMWSRERELMAALDRTPVRDPWSSEEVTS